MYTSAVVLALASSVLAQSPSPSVSYNIQFQHLTGAAQALSTLQASLPTGYAAYVQQVIPYATNAISSFLPGATSVGDVQGMLTSPKLLVPALAYAQIPPNILDGPEYYVALQAAPQVLSVVGADLSSFLNIFPSTLALTDVASFASASSDAFGSAVTSLVSTAIPQLQSILTTLESSASAVAIPQTTGCSAAASTTMTPFTTSVPVTGNYTVPASTSIATASGSPTPTIITGAASSQKGALGFVVGAVAVVAALL